MKFSVNLYEDDLVLLNNYMKQKKLKVNQMRLENV